MANRWGVSANPRSWQRCRNEARRDSTAAGLVSMNVIMVSQAVVSIKGQRLWGRTAVLPHSAVLRTHRNANRHLAADLVGHAVGLQPAGRVRHHPDALLRLNAAGGVGN